jgi:hypothetical protein
MFKGQYKYVGHSKGDFEGTKYDNVNLSDGVQAAKFRNDTGADSFPFKRGDTVTVEFDVEFGKKNPTLALKSIKGEPPFNPK